ncbi:class I tRNA ligase family protein [Candidatus Uhrbacteria bacterium]|nr:class I tRNA ligase family protein [Candidatus Uhrbacteria bacterium]
MFGMQSEFPTRYDPSGEAEIYKQWEESGAFAPSDGDAGGGKPRPYFSIVLPPPNVTGTLHAGHAVMLAIEDMMVRYHRMKRDRTLWVPGLDHAAIATQNVVEKKLKKENVAGRRTRYELGREAFLEEVAKFVEQSKARIIEQTKAMGASLDWSRLAYTLDTERSHAVREMFVRMYEAGILYRGNRIVNWCPRCKSTLADDEVEYKEEKTPFYYFKYGPVVIGTARPETKFQDKTLVVHPEDERYTRLVGQEFEVEWIEDRPLKSNVIADPVIDPTFGTGAMTITPAHSFDDFDLAQKHGLPIVTIIDEGGKLTEAAGSFAGRNAREARADIVAALEKKGLVDHIDEQYTHNLSVCYRCETPVEPLPKLQWFVDVGKKFRSRYSLSEPIRHAQGKLRESKGPSTSSGHTNSDLLSLKDLALAAVGDGPDQIKIIPERFEKEYFHWMENLRDWCISRQIWFGHRIPVWYKRATQPVHIVLVRHGEHTDTGSGYRYGKLTEKGIEQVGETARALRGEHFDVMYCSPLERTHESAQIISKEVEMEPVSDDRLREIDIGALTFEEFQKTAKAIRESGSRIYHTNWKEKFPHGESYAELVERVRSFLADVIERHAGQKVLIVTHGGVMRTVLHLIEHVPIERKPHTAHAEIMRIALKEVYRVSREPLGSNWEQDPDTLDTWFSSGMWTFSTLGWPSFAEATEGKPEIPRENQQFHPTSVLETGYDILFFWIARMILMTEFALETIPFKTVYLHGLVRDAKGRKMSKSLGNVIDPLDMIQKHGADAVRLALFIGTSPGQDTKLDEQKIAGYAKFVTKVWNIGRYVLAQQELGIRDQESGEAKKVFSPSTAVEGEREGEGRLGIADSWILSKREQLVRDVTAAYETHEYSKAAQMTYDFAWHEFADWYVESQKSEVRSQKSDEILRETLEVVLKLLHPAMPFVTEVLWARVRRSLPPTPPLLGKGGKKKDFSPLRWSSEGERPVPARASGEGEAMLIVQPWPIPDTRHQLSDTSVAAFDFLRELVTAVRQVRNTDKIAPKTLLDVTLTPGNEQERAWCADAEVQALLIHFVRAQTVRVAEGGAATLRTMVRSTGVIVTHR